MFFQGYDEYSICAASYERAPCCYEEMEIRYPSGYLNAGSLIAFGQFQQIVQKHPPEICLCIGYHVVSVRCCSRADRAFYLAIPNSGNIIGEREQVLIPCFVLLRGTGGWHNCRRRWRPRNTAAALIIFVVLITFCPCSCPEWDGAAYLAKQDAPS